MKDLRKAKRFITHGGKFHADDVFATALLLLINDTGIGPRVYYTEENRVNASHDPVDEIEIYRVNSIPDTLITDETVVYDIGHGKYDHHQSDSDVRDNGVKYAAFGLLFRECWNYLFPSKEEADIFDLNCVQMIDKTDNTGKPNPISAYISTFMPSWDQPSSDRSLSLAFDDAVRFAYRYIQGFVDKANSRHKAITVCENSKRLINRILILEKYVPYNKWAYENGIIVAVYPSLRGGYSASVVSDKDGNNIALFPKEWRSASPEKLFELTGIKTLHFCHKSGFMIAADLLDDAIKAAKYASTNNLGGNDDE